MAGFDGYKFSDQKNDEVNLLIEKFRNSFPDKNLISITPSFFNLNQKKRCWASSRRQYII